MSSIYKEDNHKEIALSRVIPYLLKFKEIYAIAEQTGDRYQIIEDIAWKLLYSLDYRTAEGVWLDYIGTKVGQPRTYLVRPDGAFTFYQQGLGDPDNGFGAGKFLGKSALYSTLSSRNDYTYRKAIQSKIIENSTDTSVDEFVEAIKLLFNAEYVRVIEDYPAGVSHIDIIGKDLFKPVDPIPVVRRMLPAGVYLGSVAYNSLYNIFDDDAFIEYSDALIPETDDFELSLVVNPSNLDTENPTALLSQGNTWASIYTPLRLYYDPTDGVVFRTSPEKYNDTYTGTTYYNDEDSNIYIDSDAEIYLNGGLLTENIPNIIKVSRINNVWTLSVNNADVDSITKNIAISNDGVKLYLGTSNAQFYNSGSLYNLLIENKTTNTIILNDPLIEDTVGTNNGVIFIS